MSNELADMLQGWTIEDAGEREAIASVIAALRGYARLQAENERLRAALERMLLEFDFMVERGVIPDVRNDIIFVEARAALAQGGEQ